MSASSVKHLDPTQVELEIAIAPEELERARERAFRQLAKNVRIPGFRPGKVPRKIFEAQYGSEMIAERAMESVVPDAYSRAIRENELEPVEQPQVELLPEEDGLPVRLRATVSVRPPIALGEYKGLVLTGPSTAVGDEEVSGALEALRKEAGTLIPVDRPVALGDVPTLDYAGAIDGTPFEGGSAEQQPTEVAEGRFIPGFVEGLVGMSAGETKAVEATFPDDYSNADLAGKTAIFTVTVHENKVPELPALDDDFAKRFGGDGANLAGLREDLRGRLGQQRRQQVRRALSGQLMDTLLEAHDFPLPLVMVDREVDHLEKEAKSYVARAGLAWDDYLAKQEKTEEALRAEYRVEAQKRVKTTLLLEAIAKAEKIEATPADVEAEIVGLERQYQQPRATILEMLGRNVDALIDGIVRTKTVEFLMDSARVVEATPPGPA